MLLESAVIHQFAFHEWGEGVLIGFELVIKAVRSGAPSPIALLDNSTVTQNIPRAF